MKIKRKTKMPKIMSLAASIEWQLRNYSWIITEFSLVIPDTSGLVGLLNLANSGFGSTQEVRNSGMLAKWPFLALIWPSWATPLSIYHYIFERYSLPPYICKDVKISSVLSLSFSKWHLLQNPCLGAPGQTIKKQPWYCALFQQCHNHVWEREGE